MIKLSSWLQGLLQLSMFQATPSSVSFDGLHDYNQLFFSSVLALSVLRTRQQGGFYLKNILKKLWYTHTITNNCASTVP
jgi:hypothetical protein